MTRDDKQACFGALETGDNGDLTPLIDLIARQQTVPTHKASEIFEKAGATPARDNVQAALEDLCKAADKAVADRAAADEQVSLRRVFPSQMRLSRILKSVSTRSRPK